MVDNFDIETASPRGSALLQDVRLIERLAHFDREVIPERRMQRAPARPWHIHRHERHCALYQGGRSVTTIESTG
jgi:hypothetical protein